MSDNVTIPTQGAGSLTPVIATRDGGAAGHYQKVDIERSQKASTASTPAQTTQGATAATVLAANAARKLLVIQNTGLTTIKLVLGSGTPTQTAYHYALQACSAADDGSGGFFISETWTGAVQAISDAAGGTMVITEVT